jgi:long-chain fatty acid transport protein
MKGKQFIAVGIITVTLSGIALANGYKILCTKSSKATGMGEAFIVQADDPSAVAYNPAGLAQLSGSQININATFCTARIKRTGPDGSIEHNNEKWETVPSLFVSDDLGTDYLSAGIGISLPNGLSTEWSEDSFARYVATYSDLFVADISPALGVKVSDRLMVGGGLNIYYSKAQLERMLDIGLAMGAPGTADTRTVLEGDGTGIGATLGAIYRVNDRHAVAVTYKSGFSIDYEGDSTTGALTIPIETTIDFPTVVVIGYAFRPTDKLKLETNLDWTYWRSVDDIVIRFSAPGIPAAVQAQAFDNTIAYKFGAEYQASDAVALRCGYIFNENATDASTWRPSLPDTDTHFITAGLGYTHDALTLDAALQFVQYEKRTIDNNVDLNESSSSSSIDGTYRTIAPCASISATYRF